MQSKGLQIYHYLGVQKENENRGALPPYQYFLLADFFAFPTSMKTLSTLRLLAATLFISSASLLGACSTGTDTADTDVERGAAKDYGMSDATPGRDLDSVPSTRAIPDTAGQKTIEQQYDQTLQATDHNHDGKAD